jgi:hypothetical protein
VGFTAEVFTDLSPAQATFGSAGSSSQNPSKHGVRQIIPSHSFLKFQWEKSKNMISLMITA